MEAFSEKRESTVVGHVILMFRGKIIAVTIVVVPMVVVIAVIVIIVVARGEECRKKN